MRAGSCFIMGLAIKVSSIFLNVHPTYSQPIPRDNHHNALRRGVAAADRADFSKALEIFSSILRESPGHINTLSQMAITLIDSQNNRDSAIVLFHQVLELLPLDEQYSSFGIYIRQMLARAYNLNHQPSNAITILNKINNHEAPEEVKIEIERDIRNSFHSLILLNNPVAFNVTSVEQGINSRFDDHSPVICPTGKRIYFTSRRPVGKSRKRLGGQYPENVFTAELSGGKWGEAKPVMEFYRANAHTSILSISPDGNQMFLYRTTRGDSKNIMVSYRVNNQWQKPEMMPSPVNSAWDETHASYSPNQEVLYFTSNRPGGFGGLDIYMAKRDDHGKWGEAINLGPSVNTSLNEDASMIHPGGQLIYFISEGHSSMGGYDVFYSYKQPDGSWSKAVNMGYPVNSADDDLLFMPLADRSRAFMSSYRFSAKSGGANIYQVDFDESQTGHLVVVDGAMGYNGMLPDEGARLLAWVELRENEPLPGALMAPMEASRNRPGVVPSLFDPGYFNISEVSIPMAFAQAYGDNLLSGSEVMAPMIPREIHLPAFMATSPRAGNQEEMAATVANELFTIQILALLRSTAASPRFLDGISLPGVTTFKGNDGFLRFVTGSFNSRAEATNYLESIRRDNRFQDAWIRNLDQLKEISKTESVIVPVNLPSSSRTTE